MIPRAAIRSGPHLQPELVMELRKHERLILARRRRGENQKVAAARHGVSLYRYRKWEIGEDPDFPLAAAGGARQHERLFITRMRAGYPLGKVAQAIGITRWWLCQIEHGKAPAARLETYWGQQQQSTEEQHG